MFDTPVDAWYVWVGLAIVSVATLGVALAFPTATAPDAAAAADVVDATAAHSHPATANRSLDADEVRLGTDGIALRDAGGTSRATFVYGPVTPVVEGSVLWEVTRGAAPAHVFDDAAAFRRATRDARRRTPTWRRSDDRLTVRSVSWEGIDVTLVHA